MAIRFSEVLGKMKGSDLGPLLALTAQPDIISFAGGLPAPITFPLKELEEVDEKIADKTQKLHTAELQLAQLQTKTLSAERKSASRYEPVKATPL